MVQRLLHNSNAIVYKGFLDLYNLYVGIQFLKKAMSKPVVSIRLVLLLQ